MRKSQKYRILVGVQYTPFTIASLIIYKNEIQKLLNGELVGYAFYKYIDPNWDNLYKDKCGFETELKYKKNKKNLLAAKQIFSKIQSKKGIHNIKFENVIVGDLIYDTFLNRYSEVTIFPKDRRLLNIIYQSLNIYEQSKNFINKNKVAALITDQNASYIYHGILARLCHKKKIKVYSINDYSSYKSGLYKMYFPDTIRGASIDPYWKYKEKFEALSTVQKSKSIQMGLDLLQKRMSGNSSLGVWGSEAAYNSKATSTIWKKQKSILILLHEFNDSPSCYRWSLFTDFYEWAEFTISESLKTGMRVMVKPHPGTVTLRREIQLRAQSKAIEKLQNTYRDAIFLTGLESNIDLLNAGIIAAYTVHGTVGHEFPSLGIPVINAGDNPHIDYNFCYTARTIDDYRAAIANAQNLSVTTDDNEIGEFVFMRYLNTSKRSLLHYEADNILNNELDRHCSACEAEDILKNIF